MQHHMFGFSNKRFVYMDFAAGTPVRREVLSAMEPFWSLHSANPSAIHSEGVTTRTAIEKAREQIARLLHIRTDDVVFTGSGTESNNIAILGTIAQKKKEGVSYADMEIISTAIEHPSVAKTLAYASSLGVTVKCLDLNEDGSVQTQSITQLLSKKTILVTCAYVNSEIGVVQPISKIARSVRAFEKANGVRIYVHTDAAQAPLWLPCSLAQLNADIISLDAGKCYGPKGIGVIAYRHDVSIAPIMYGGGQEHGLRPATENTPLVVGATKAFVLAQQKYIKRAEKVASVRDLFIKKLCAIDGVVLNGSVTSRVANNINISIPHIDTEFATIVLNEKGIACSTKSACSGATGSGSSVVYAITQDQERANSTLRFTLGEETTKQDVAYVADVLATHIDTTRKRHKKLTAH